MWLVRDVQFRQFPGDSRVGRLGLVFLVVAGDVHVVSKLTFAAGLGLVVVRRVRVVGVHLPVGDPARVVDPVRTEPVVCKIEGEDFRVSSYGVAVTEEALASFVPACFAKVLGDMCAGMCTFMLSMHIAHMSVTTDLPNSVACRCARRTAWETGRFVPRRGPHRMSRFFLRVDSELTCVLLHLAHLCCFCAGG